MILANPRSEKDTAQVFNFIWIVKLQMIQNQSI